MGDRTPVESFEANARHLGAFVAAHMTTMGMAGGLVERLESASELKRHPVGAHANAAQATIKLPVPPALRVYLWERFLCADDTLAEVVGTLLSEPLRGTAAEQGLAAELTAEWLWNCALNVEFRAQNPDVLTGGPIVPGSVLWVPWARASSTFAPLGVAPSTAASGDLFNSFLLAPVAAPSAPRLEFDARDFVRRYGPGPRKHGGYFYQLSDSHVAQLNVRSYGLKYQRYVSVDAADLEGLTGVSQSLIEPTSGEPLGANQAIPAHVGVQPGLGNSLSAAAVLSGASPASVSFTFSGSTRAINGRVATITHPGERGCLDTTLSLLGAVYHGRGMPSGGLSRCEQGLCALAGPAVVYVDAGELSAVRALPATAPKKPRHELKGSLVATAAALLPLPVRPTEIGFVPAHGVAKLTPAEPGASFDVVIRNDSDAPLYVGEDSNGRVVPHPDYDSLPGAIDDELRRGHPIVVGVTFFSDPNDHHVKDHYVLIVAKGRDAFGVFYAFYDPAVPGGNKLEKQRLRPKKPGAALADPPADNAWQSGCVLGTARADEQLWSRPRTFEVCQYYLNNASVKPTWARPASGFGQRLDQE